MMLGFAARWIGYTFAGAWIEHQHPDFLPNAKKHPPSHLESECASRLLCSYSIPKHLGTSRHLDRSSLDIRNPDRLERVAQIDRHDRGVPRLPIGVM